MSPSPFISFSLFVTPIAKEGHAQPLHVYSSGHTLTGNVKVVMKEDTHVKAIMLQVVGKAVWNGHKLDKSLPTERTYFNRDIVLMERPPGKENAGDFTWRADHDYDLPWECPLPRSSPTSYEGVGGHVRYTVRAVVILRDKEVTYGRKQAITVLSPPPHNLPENLFNEISASHIQSSGSCCCRRKMTGEIKLSKSIFMPGETVFATITVNAKKLKKPLQNVKCQLLENLAYYDGGAKNEHSSVVIEQTHDKWPANVQKFPKSAVQTFDNVALFTIPSCAPSTLRHSLRSTLPKSMTNDTIVSADGTTYSNYSTLTKHPHQLFNVEYEIVLSIDDGVVTVSVPVTIATVPSTQEDGAQHPTGYGARTF